MVKLYNENDVEIPVQHSNFPAGEVYVKILNIYGITNNMKVVLDSANSDSIIIAMMLADAVKCLNDSLHVTLYADYMPYSRQDRACTDGESSSLLLFMSMLELVFDKIITLDLHNPSATNAYPITNLQVNYSQYIEYTEGLVIVSPDKGAVSRCLLASGDKVPVAILNKTRKLSGIVQESQDELSTERIVNAKSLLIVDDICDGGATFLAAAKVLRELNPKAKLHLLVTHGIFSQGMEKLNEVFSTVKAVNYYKKD